MRLPQRCACQRARAGQGGAANRRIRNRSVRPCERLRRSERHFERCCRRGCGLSCRRGGRCRRRRGGGRAGSGRCIGSSIRGRRGSSSGRRHISWASAGAPASQSARPASSAGAAASSGVGPALSSRGHDAFSSGHRHIGHFRGSGCSSDQRDAGLCGLADQGVVRILPGRNHRDGHVRLQPTAQRLDQAHDAGDLGLRPRGWIAAARRARRGTRTARGLPAAAVPMSASVMGRAAVRGRSAGTKPGSRRRDAGSAGSGRSSPWRRSARRSWGRRWHAR